MMQEDHDVMAVYMLLGGGEDFVMCAYLVTFLCELGFVLRHYFKISWVSYSHLFKES